LIEGNLLLNRAQLLRGGRWLFTLLYDGTAQIQDLDQVDPQPQFLFRSHLDNEEPLAEFQIWIDETKSDLTFLVATYSFATHGKRKDRICIHKIDFAKQNPSPSVKLVTTIPDYPRTSLRSWVALSDKFFSQCFLPWNENRGIIGDDTVKVLQVRRYSQNSPRIAEYFVEKHVECTGTTNIFFLPNDRLGLATSTFVAIYAISSDQDAATPPILTSLHRLPISQTASLLSAPFFGSHCTYLISTYEGTFRRITINHDYNSPPTVQELGNFESQQMRVQGVRFGPSASVVYQPIRSLKVVTYEYRVDKPCFQRKHYEIPDDHLYSVIWLTAFDDAIGRIVLQTNASRNQLLVLDLI